jgi:hypothetical protein
VPIDLSPTGPETPLGSDAATVLAAVVIVAAWFTIFVVVRRARHGGLAPEQQRRLADIRAQLDRVGGPSLTIPDTAAGSVRETYGGQLKSLFTNAPEVDERLSTPLRALARRWRVRIGPLPRLAVWIGTEAVVLGLPAALVLVEVSALSTGTQLQLPSLTAVLDVLTVGVDVLALFPATNLIWALLITLVLELYTFLYAHGVAIALVLAAGAAIIAYLDRQTKDSIDLRLYPRRRATIRHAITRVVAIWLTGTLLAHADVIPHVPDLSILGAIAAFALALYYTAGAVASLGRRLNNEYRALTNFSLPAPIEGGPRFRRERIVGYLLARKTVAALGVLAIPLIPVYIYEALTQGIWVKLDAFLASGPLVQAAVLAILTATIYLLSRIDPEEWRDLYLAGVRAGSRNAVRTVLLARGLPILAIIAAVLLGTAFSLPAWVIATAAILAGLLVRGLGKLWKRLTYRARQVDIETTLPNVDVMVDHIEGPGGHRIGVARVHTHWLAWPRDDVLRDQIIRDVEAYFRGDGPEESLPGRYYDHLQEVGRVDPEEVVESTRAEARSELEHVVHPRSAPREVVEDRLYGAYPDRVVDRVLRDAKRVGRISEGDDEYYWHDHAPSQ